MKGEAAASIRSPGAIDAVARIMVKNVLLNACSSARRERILRKDPDQFLPITQHLISTSKICSRPSSFINVLASANIVRIRFIRSDWTRLPLSLGVDLVIKAQALLSSLSLSGGYTNF